MSAITKIFGLYVIITSVIIIVNVLMICYLKKREGMNNLLSSF